MFKKVTYLTTFLLLGFSCVFSQSGSVDQLANAVLLGKGHKGKETIHLRITDSLYHVKSTKFHYYYLDSLLKKTRRLKDKEFEANVLMSLGNFYLGTGNNFNSVEVFRKSIAIYEELKDYSGLNSANTNIGNTFFYMGDSEKALMYYKKAVEDYKKITKTNSETELKLATLYNNMGSVYCTQQEMYFGRTYFDLALEIWAKHKDSISIAYVYNNFAQIFLESKKLDSAQIYYQKALHLKEKFGDLDDRIDARNNLAALYTTRKKPEIALKYLKEAYALLDTTIYSRSLLNCYNNLYGTYKALHDVRNELKYYKLWKVASDSAANNDQINELTRHEMQFEFAKIHLSDSLRSLEEIKLKDLKLSEGKKQSYFLILGLLLTITGIIAIYSRFKVTIKQKKIIEEQKALVDIKNKEILDSITYAKRLQEAILPPISLWKQYLPESFVFYKPKDIVAGDFYWMHVVQFDNLSMKQFDNESKSNNHQIDQLSNCQILMAAADCTGHGVPGAMVSVVCSNALDRAVKEFGLTEPGKILDKVRELVIETFEKSENDVKDGMDISLLSIDFSKKQIQWSGANNRLLYLQQNELKEIKANRESVGKSDHQKPFTTHPIPFIEGSVFYLFTDGLIDQFGGEKMKKFNINNFKTLLENNKNLTINEQFQVILDAFTQWKGSNEQIDDITVLGIKI